MSVLTTLLCVVVGVVSAIAARDPSQPVTVFRRGENGYFCVKIPSIVYLHSGTMLAFGEARMGSCADMAWTDLVMKRSIDNGTTWSDMQVVYSNSTASSITQVGNAAPLQLRDDNGTIVMPFCVNNSQVFLTRSTDEGRTWSTPVSYTHLTLPTNREV